MTQETLDAQPDSVLLSAWVKHRDRDAIGQLISRHINFVYTVAFRQVRGDAHLAEDITQAVFILLLQKAHRIHNEAAMARWLFTTTRYAAANAMKMLRRRKHYEHQAAMLATVESTDQTDALEQSDCQPMLNEAINSLPKSDRTCVIMSYLQQRPHNQIAAGLGISEEAARKRISRAVARMREFFASRGVVAPAAAIGLSLVKQIIVSAQFTESTINVATLSQSAVQSSSAMTIAKGVSKMFFAMKLKVAATMAAVFFGSIATAQVVHRILTPMVAPATSGQIQIPVTKSSSVIDLGDGVSVNFVGVAKWGTNDWHGIDGKPIAAPATPRPQFRVMPPPTHQVLIRVTSLTDAIADIKVLGSSGGGNSISIAEKGTRDFFSGFTLEPSQESADVVVQIADGPWAAALTTQPNSRVWAMDGKEAAATFTPLIERDGKTVVFVSASHLNGPWRLVCKDLNGEKFVGEEHGGAGNGSISTVEFHFDLPPVAIASLELQTRPYRKQVTAKGITLDPAKPTTPQISVEKSN